MTCYWGKLLPFLCQIQFVSELNLFVHNPQLFILGFANVVHQNFASLLAIPVKKAANNRDRWTELGRQQRELTWSCLECFVSNQPHYGLWFVVPRCERAVRLLIPGHFDCPRIFRRGCSFAKSMRKRMYKSTCGGWRGALWWRLGKIAPVAIKYSFSWVFFQTI